MDDITDTLAPKSDQLDAIELVDGPRTFTVERVVVKKGAEQPVSVYFAEFPRPWRPGTNQRRALAFCWGKQSAGWVGRRVTLMRDPDVVYGGKAVGGTRIKYLSHIDRPMDAPILLSQGKPGTYRVEPMPTDLAAQPQQQSSKVDELRAEWMNATPERQAEIEAEVARLTGDDQ